MPIAWFVPIKKKQYNNRDETDNIQQNHCEKYQLPQTQPVIKSPKNIRQIAL